MTRRWLATALTLTVLQAALVSGAWAQAAADSPATSPPPTQSPQPAPTTTPAGQSAAPQEQAPAATAEPPADGAALPEVQVIQKKAEPKPEAPKPKATVAKSAPPQTPPQAPAPEPAPEPVVTEVAPAATYGGPPPGNTAVRMSPVGGSEIPLDKVPSGVSVVSSSAIARDGGKQVQNVLQQNVPGIILSDTAGSGFRTDVSYRGFDASPIGGRSQAIAVYQNGIRINEAFGDIVNWDALPSNAISDIAVVANNPVFGLNAIGGAISVTMKDGFLYQGAEIDVMGGSFGRRQLSAQAGAKSGGVAAYAAAEYVAEDGFRDFSAAEVERMYSDLGFKGDTVELHLSFLGARSDAGVVTAAPEDLLNIAWDRTFTSPQDTQYEVLMPSLSGTVKATETLSLSGVAYYRSFKQNVLDGNLSDAAPCTGAPGPGFLCVADDGVEEPLVDHKGKFVPTPDGPIGSLERIDQEAESYGASVQAVEKARVFDHANQLIVGASYDHGQVGYTTSSEVGVIGDKFVVTGTGAILADPEDVAPRLLDTENTYYGLYFSDTFDVTDALALTVGGRYNHAEIKLKDLTGDFPGLNATNTYQRFNPMVGATYKLLPGLSVYGGYSEANRAPTAAELGCAEPTNPCFIESFLTDDPPLKQVVSNTYEAGLRGEAKSWDHQSLTWSLGYFRTLNIDDIINVAATQTGRGYFLNAGDTLRQGVEASLGYQSARLSFYGSYAFIDATYQTPLVLPAPNTPGADDCPGTPPPPPAEPPTCNFVAKGDNLPGIPQHRFKAGFEYWLTGKWKFGTDLIAATDQRFFGDDANNNETLKGYTRVDLHTSYDLNEHVQLYGMAKNVLDQRYGLYGTYFDTAEANEAAEPSGVKLHNPRSITPAQPFSVYAGARVKF